MCDNCVWSLTEWLTNNLWHCLKFSDVTQDCKKAVTGKSYYNMDDKPVCAACVGVSSGEEEEEDEES